MDVSFEKYFCLDQKKIVSKVIWKLVISSNQIVIAPGNIVISSGQIYLNFKKKWILLKWDIDVSFKKCFCLN